MTTRAEQELALLRARWPRLDFVEAGQWVILRDYELGPGWSHSTADVAFQIPELVGQAPYGFWTWTGPTTAPLTYNGQTPTNYNPPAAAPFDSTGRSWSMFSWQPERWNASDVVPEGDNMTHFANSFGARFAEGA